MPVTKDEKEMKDSLENPPLPDETEQEEKPSKALSVIDEQYFHDNARVGLEDLTPDDLPTPVLKIVNSEVLKADGQTPVRYGHFYYPALDADMETVTCTFLTYVKQMQPVYMKPEIQEKVYVIMGAIDSTSGFKPFKMYLRGGNVGAFKKFLGQVTARNYPMYSLKLELASEKRTSQEGKTYYSLLINAQGVRDDAADILTLEELTRQFGGSLRAESNAQEEPVRQAQDNGNFPPVADDIEF